jgi:hypothetical protein
MRNASLRHAEFVEGIALLAVSAGLYGLSFTFPRPLITSDIVVGPLTIPRLVLVIVGLLGITRASLALRIPHDDTTSFPVDPVVAATAALAFAYVIAAAYLGMILPMPFFCVVLAWIWGGRDPLRLTVLAVGVPVFVWVFFDVLFQAQLPLLPTF